MPLYREVVRDTLVFFEITLDVIEERNGQMENIFAGTVISSV